MQPDVSALHPLDPRSKAAPAAASRNLARNLATVALILPIAVLIPLLGRQLWAEWSLLQADERSLDSSAVIGFRNVYPVVSRASHPQPWHREEGHDLFIWSGWKPGQGHGWFKLAAGECDPSTLGNPMGRDVARAIDFPDVETAGGEIWGRMPDEADVAGVSVGEAACAYPKFVLMKVLVVNDTVGGVPCLVYHDPFSEQEPRQDVAVYDPRVDGRRIVMGNGGFTTGGRHVLYDRGTESLWVDRGEGLESFSGAMKGKRLALVRRVAMTNWGDWESENPDSRLLVGAMSAPTASAE